jgi:hypothetical protein
MGLPVDYRAEIAYDWNRAWYDAGSARKVAFGQAARLANWGAWLRRISPAIPQHCRRRFPNHLGHDVAIVTARVTARSDLQDCS